MSTRYWNGYRFRDSVDDQPDQAAEAQAVTEAFETLPMPPAEAPLVVSVAELDPEQRCACGETTQAGEHEASVYCDPDAPPQPQLAAGRWGPSPLGMLAAVSAILAPPSAPAWDPEAEELRQRRRDADAPVPLPEVRDLLPDPGDEPRSYRRG